MSDAESMRVAIAYENGYAAALKAVDGIRSPQRHAMTVEQQQELAQFINRNSLENGCDMPDFAIAAYLAQCYQALCIATEQHVDWEKIMPPGFEDAGRA